MTLGVNAGFRHLLDASALAALQYMRVSVIRRGADPDMAPDLRQAALRQCAESGLRPVVLLGIERHAYTAAQATAHAVTVWRECQDAGVALTALELGNEPDLAPSWQTRASDYGRLTRAVVGALRDAGCPEAIIVGSVSQTLARGWRYWQAMDCQAWTRADAVLLGVHRYIHRLDAGLAPAPHTSRSQELRRWIAEGLPLAITETGVHTADQSWGGLFGLRWLFGTTRRLTDDQAAQELAHDWAFWQSVPEVVLVCHYQLNDGIPRDRPVEGQDRFGLRDVEGRIKPQGDALRRWQEAHA
jgi:hypothetical protein